MIRHLEDPSLPAHIQTDRRSGVDKWCDDNRQTTYARRNESLAHEGAVDAKKVHQGSFVPVRYYRIG